MSAADASRKKILELIKNGRVTPEQGFQLLKALSNGKTAPAQQAAETNEQDIAIIGISGQFPGARNVQEFWQNLKNGVDSITEVPRDRWDVEQFYDPDPSVPGKTYAKWGGFLADADKFDPLFFNMSPREAETMDPQQRLLLQESWRALEDAGYAPESLSGSRCGVFAGVVQTQYDWMLQRSGAPLDGQFITATANGFPPARVAYTLNLIGPTMTIDTACSSSLVAIHQACQSIRNGESDMALAGGVNILPAPENYLMCAQGGMLSRDGRCKTFDNSADGFVPGEGAAMIVLKSLRQAIADHDHIYGVIKGSTINQDGKTNGIMAPSGNSQVLLATDLYERYGINPETISYVEAHGTGTKLGDPIEVSALTRSFGRYTQKKQYCVIGSVKTNIGHLYAAAGVTGIIKILLCMKYGKLVPSLHLKQVNEHLHFEDSPFYVLTELADWHPQSYPRKRAAISSYGLTGTNCHMVIEERP